MTGTFITFEGPDGAGKTSVLETLVPMLQSISKVAILLTREPGGSPISEKIRQLILDVHHTEMDARTEALLYAASRRQHLTETILPALQTNQLVICDRFVDSSIAYQGNGREIGMAEVAAMNTFATDNIQPNFTIYLDVPADIGLARIQRGRTEQYDRLDQEALSFHERVRSAYLMIARKNPKRVLTIDATKPLEQVVTNCFQAIIKQFPASFDK